ncbi:terpenoid cyclases/Protein prenyltransferase [Cystobasidium minutum MCA 4210]|uniref:terpenoid cyclases/Protein prenyltransferase n=1 Tax=Cystobasidium minutum MCA 4210 TaxID=1397322 RepID=UPI0034CE1E29|eukprot:jgi/Rhomi1/51326/CE51325_396
MSTEKNADDSTDTKLLVDLHVQYIQSLDKKRDELAYHLTEHLRMNGIYWGLTSLALMGRKDALDRQEMIDWVMSCWVEEEGAFAPHPGHDPHLHPTLSAIQILLMQDALHLVNVEKVTNFVLSLQDPETGSFAGDEWGEIDTRFTYCAVACLSLLGQLDKLDKEKTVAWLEKCKNHDGGFGMVQGAESHAAQVWTSVGALAILGRLDVVDKDTLCWWLCERQLPNGGLNGRPEKLEDVCYSWWVFATLSILGRGDWISQEKLQKFILSCQDTEKGGVADRPEDVADIWHTVFGLAGLSLMGYEGLQPVDPVYCLPASVTKNLHQ